MSPATAAVILGVAAISQAPAVITLINAGLRDKRKHQAAKQAGEGKS